MRGIALWFLLFAFGFRAWGGTLVVTTWNLEWFPNGSPKIAPPEEQNRRIAGAAATIRKLNPDVLLLQEMQDYRACQRLIEAIGPESYQICVCSAFKDATGAVGAQQVAILA